MKTALLFVALGLCLVFVSCTKSKHENLDSPHPASNYKEYIIPAGQHYALENNFKPVAAATLKFAVKFDSSAIYTTVNPENQYDINKLYGFADNGGHHQLNSARFGWCWSGKALQLFAYVYNNGTRISKELTSISIGSEHQCSITIQPGQYYFSVDGKRDSLPRYSTTPTAEGYQLYPYFGGDEPAPHDVRIWIRDEE